MEIDYDGDVWTWDMSTLAVDEAMAVEEYTGKKALEWITTFDDVAQASTKDLQVLLWVLRRRDGHKEPPAAVMLDVFKFAGALNEGMVALQEKILADMKAETAERATKGLPPKKANPPTAAGGPRSGKSAASTSRRSRAASTSTPAT
ncbi:MAG: hypothetical protein ACRDU4_00465 [Mycobacterium sp.]